MLNRIYRVIQVSILFALLSGTISGMPGYDIVKRATGDLDGDGTPETVIANGNSKGQIASQLKIHASDGSLLFNDPKMFLFWNDLDGRRVDPFFLVDFNGDGKDNIVSRIPSVMGTKSPSMFFVRSLSFARRDVDVDRLGAFVEVTENSGRFERVPPIPVKPGGFIAGKNIVDWSTADFQANGRIYKPSIEAFIQEDQGVFKISIRKLGLKGRPDQFRLARVKRDGSGFIIANWLTPWSTERP